MREEGSTITRGGWLAAAAAALLLTSAMTARPVQAAGLAVRVSGSHLVDGNGQLLQLRGVDRSGTEYMCVQNGGIFDGPSTDASLAAIAAWHATAIRVPLNEDCWLGVEGEPVGGLTPAAYRTAIQNYVALAHQHGLYVILELHWSAPAGFKATWQEGMADAAYSPTMWSQVGAAFKNDPATIFDLFNEPVGIDWPCWLNGCAYGGDPTNGRGQWPTAGMQQMVNAVRAAGANNVIMLGGLSYANDLTGWLSHEPSDPAHQLAASFHTYNFNVCNSLSCWNSQEAPVAAQVPIITGEVGEDNGNHSFIDSYMAWADPRGISYLGWTWDTWGCGNGPVLIADYAGTPCQTFGSGYKAHLLSFGPTPTPTPAPTPTPTPAPTPTPTPAPTPTPTPTPAPTPTPSTTPTPQPTITAAPSSTPTARPTPYPSPRGTSSPGSVHPTSKPSAGAAGSGITALPPSSTSKTPAGIYVPASSGTDTRPYLLLSLLASAGIVVLALKRLF